MKKFIPKSIKALVKRMRLFWRRRYYYLAEIFSLEVPVHPISWVPDGFIVQQLGESPLRLINNFCSEAEAADIVATAKDKFGPGNTGTLVNNVRSSQICALAGQTHDGNVLSLLYRCSILFGVPYTHCSRIVFAAIGPDTDQEYFAHIEPSEKLDMQHALMLYLNEAGGETVFNQLKLAVKPQHGRALCWSLDHSAGEGAVCPLERPVSDNNIKYVLILWFCDEPVMESVHDQKAHPQARKGEPLKGTEVVPAGVWAPQVIDLEGVFGQPDKMKGLV